MITVRHRVLGRSRAACARLACPALVGTALVGTALAMTVLVAACGSSGHPGASAGSPASTSAVKQTCQQVDDVLSDGPDPGTDPLGYAEAQILPLHQIRTSNPALSAAVSTLAGDYQSYFAARGAGRAVKSSLTSAMNRINSLCPGAGATA
jgi:hypothetical protein